MFSQDGAIWKGDMSTGEGEVVVPPVGAMSLGMDYDKRTGYLYVAGGFNGGFPRSRQACSADGVPLRFRRASEEA